MRNYYFLHPELMSTEAPDIIMAKVRKLDEMKDRLYSLNAARNELEKCIAAEEKELNSIKGVLFDYDEILPEIEGAPVETVNILLKGVSNSKF